MFGEVRAASRLPADFAQLPPSAQDNPTKASTAKRPASRIIESLFRPALGSLFAATAHGALQGDASSTGFPPGFILSCSRAPPTAVLVAPSPFDASAGTIRLSLPRR